MTDPTALRPSRAVVDLHASLAAGETLYGAFAGLGSPVATEIVGPRRLRLADHRPRARRRHRIGPAGQPPRDRGDTGRRARPPAVGRAAAHRPRARPRRRTGSWSRGSTRADQAREAVSFMRYPPDGTRGLALSTRGAGLGEHGHADVQAINRRGSSASSRSSRASAVDDADEIAAIDGVDVLFVGPTDLSHALGVPGQFDDPSTWPRLDEVVAACRRPRQGGGHPPVRRRPHRPAPRAAASRSSGSARTAAFVHERRQGHAGGGRPGLSAATRTSPRPGSATPRRWADSGRADYTWRVTEITEARRRPSRAGPHRGTPARPQPAPARDRPAGHLPGRLPRARSSGPAPAIRSSSATRRAA